MDNNAGVITFQAGVEKKVGRTQSGRKITPKSTPL
jgi:hypothetical protein